MMSLDRKSRIPLLLAQLQVPPIDVDVLCARKEITLKDDEHFITIKIRELSPDQLFRELGHTPNMMTMEAYVKKVLLYSSPPQYLHVRGEDLKNPNISNSVVFDLENGATIYSRGESGHVSGVLSMLSGRR